MRSFPTSEGFFVDSIGPGAANGTLVLPSGEVLENVPRPPPVRERELRRLDEFLVTEARTYSFARGAKPGERDLQARDGKTGQLAWQSTLANGTSAKVVASERRLYIVAPIASTSSTDRPASARHDSLKALFSPARASTMLRAR